MIEYENNCVDCGLPCLYDSCRYYREKHLHCDRCGYEVDTLYLYDGEQLCYDCLLGIVPKITL